MKRIVAVLLSIGLYAFVFTGCGSEPYKPLSKDDFEAYADGEKIANSNDGLLDIRFQLGYGDYEPEQLETKRGIKLNDKVKRIELEYKDIPCSVMSATTASEIADSIYQEEYLYNDVAAGLKEVVDNEMWVITYLYVVAEDKIYDLESLINSSDNPKQTFSSFKEFGLIQFTIENGRVINIYTRYLVSSKK